MAGFTEAALVKKLADLNSSQQSIQTLSLWLIHHRKHLALIVKVWMRELVKANNSKKLTFMYLANDVIQNSKKKGPEFGTEFEGTMKKAYEHMGTWHPDAKTRQGLNRILQVWEEREVYDPKKIAEWRKVLEVEAKKPRKEPPSAHVPAPKERRHSETVVEVDGKTEAHIILSPTHNPPGDPPEPEELDLEKSASLDAAVRERIANLPPEVSQIQLLSKLQDRMEAEQLSSRVGEAVSLLTDYNARLATEMEERKKLKQMLQDFLHAQKELLLQAEERHVEYLEKLQKVYQVRDELKSHLQNLPDLTQLPDATGGLAPLPSAGDLFRMPN
ncbi:hypothetical protein B566_EDAN005945 [Ephemera danica]|nr:hypothetical protein B566_EDAN005945 [Ephemera danica]